MAVGSAKLGKKIMYWGGIAAALGTISAMAYGVTDYAEIRPIIKKELMPVMSDVKQLQASNILLRWQMLNNKRLYGGGLTFQEMQEFCALSRELGYVGIPECGI